jgi:hypothetical protein
VNETISAHACVKLMQFWLARLSLHVLRTSSQLCTKALRHLRTVSRFISTTYMPWLMHTKQGITHDTKEGAAMDCCSSKQMYRLKTIYPIVNYTWMNTNRDSGPVFTRLYQTSHALLVYLDEFYEKGFQWMLFVEIHATKCHNQHNF